MGFYIEELPTELNGITMQEADYLADEFLKDTPCDRMWDAMRALRDFYETVTSEAVEVADRKTEPQTAECPFDDSIPCEWVCTEYGKCKYKPQTEPQTEECNACVVYNGDGDVIAEVGCEECDRTDCAWK